MDSVVSEYINDKYGSDAPDSDRFKNEIGEYHASEIGTCERRLKWKFERNPQSDPSPYFELGRMYERMYGRALRNKYGDDRVLQDVEVEIHVTDDITIVGESDWCVLREPYDGDTLKYVLHTDGTRVEMRDNETREVDIGEQLVEKVIETKTTKAIKWKQMYGHSDGHEYQIGVYLWAIGVPGYIVYMERNDASEVSFSIPYNKMLCRDIELRARRHHKNMQSDVLPPTTPLSDQQCKYCPFTDECKQIGGSQWS